MQNLGAVFCLAFVASLLVPSLGFAEAPKGPAGKVPLTVVILNREDQSLHVYPSKGLELFLSDPLVKESSKGFAHVSKLIPIGALPEALAEPQVINSLAKPLSERAPVYVQTVLRQLETLSPVLAPAWTAASLRVLSRARGFESLRQGGASTWPTQIPLLLTELADPKAVFASGATPSKEGALVERGLLVAIEVRGDSAAGPLEQVDFLAFGGGGFVRTYWSRDLFDPTYFKPVDEIMTQVSQKFVQRVKAADSNLAGEGGEDAFITLRVHREVNVSVIQKIQQTLSAVKPGTSLEAANFDRDFVEYRLSLGPTNAGAFLGSMRELAAGALPIDLSESTNEAGQLESLRVTPGQEAEESPQPEVTPEPEKQ